MGRKNQGLEPIYIKVKGTTKVLIDQLAKEKNISKGKVVDDAIYQYANPNKEEQHAKDEC